jgi:UDP-hydrolysing UDP-N-acetyl-D-glucosamine 2-epimerase
MQKNNKKKYKVAYVTGSRSEFGYMKRPLEEINRLPGVSVVVFATNMHTAQGFGETIQEVNNSAFRTIPLKDGTNGKTLVSMVSAIGSNISQLSELFAKEKLDLLIVEGDRGEQLAAALVASYLNIPVLHRGGGNTSGSIDNKIRNALTAISEFHFPSHKKLAGVLEKKGIPRKNIITIGGPVADAIARKEYLNSDKTREKYQIGQEQILLLAYHPVTEEFGKAVHELEEILEAIEALGIQTIAIGANADADGSLLNERMKEFQKTHSFFSFHTHVPREEYLGLLNVTDVLIGNTSSGFSELPSFKKPYVLVGSRQNSRFGEGPHIIHVSAKKSLLIKAIKHALTNDAFRRKLRHVKNPYGNGDFYKRFPLEVLKILKNL